MKKILFNLTLTKGKTNFDLMHTKISLLKKSFHLLIIKIINARFKTFSKPINTDCARKILRILLILDIQLVAFYGEVDHTSIKKWNESNRKTRDNTVEYSLLLTKVFDTSEGAFCVALYRIHVFSLHFLATFFNRSDEFLKFSIAFDCRRYVFFKELIYFVF